MLHIIQVAIVIFSCCEKIFDKRHIIGYYVIRKSALLPFSPLRHGKTEYLARGRLMAFNGFLLLMRTSR